MTGNATTKDQQASAPSAGRVPDGATTITTTAAVHPPTAGKEAAPGTRDVEDSDDTMKNLRKTFAGIFGDM